MKEELTYIGSGSYGIIMKYKDMVIKQIQCVKVNDAFKNEVEHLTNAYNINPNIFVKIIKSEVSKINLAELIGQKMRLLVNDVNIDIGYITMEYIECGDLYNIIKNKSHRLDIHGVVGCYIDALYTMHNIMHIIHSDITSSNILVQYVGPNYRHMIKYKNEQYILDTKGFTYKVCDFGLSESIKDLTKDNKIDSLIFRDYLMFYYLFFESIHFDNAQVHQDMLDNMVKRLNMMIEDRYTANYIKYFVNNYNYKSVNYYYQESKKLDSNNILFYDLPDALMRYIMSIEYTSV